MILALATLALPAPPPETIVVRAERLSAPVISGQRLSGDILERQSGVRLDEALRLVPGVGLFRRTSSGAANATIQGLSLRPIAPNGAGRALVSLDGVPQNDPFGGWIYWGRYDPIFLEQVDVKRGGAGAGFGPMALTGTLDLTEARGQPAALALSYGSAQAAHIARRGSISSPGAVFTAMATYDTSDGTIPVVPRQRGFVDSPIDFQALSLALVTDIAQPDGTWSFRAAGFSEDKGAGLMGGQSAAYGLDVSVARRIEGPRGESRFIIFGQGRDFSNQTVAVAAGRGSATPAVNQYATPSSALGGSFAFVPDAGRALPSWSVEWRRAQGQSRELFRYIGKDFTRTRIAGGEQDLIGLAVSLPRPMTFGIGQLQLDGGLRADYWANRNGIRLETDRATGASILTERAKDQSGTVMTGRLSLARVDGPARLTLYRTFRPPTLNELHRPFRVGNDVTEANAALKPEILVGLDLDVSNQWRVSGGTLGAFVTFYVNRLDNPIGNITLSNGPGVFPRVGFLPAGGSLRERRNVGHINASGLEARVEWSAGRFAPQWLLGTSITDARVNGGALLPQLTGKRPTQAPTWSAIASLTLPIVDTLSLSATVRGESARFEDDLNTRKLAPYGALDMRAAWQLTPATEIFLTGENIFDSPIATAQSGDGIVSQTQGRMVRLGVRFGG